MPDETVCPFFIRELYEDNTAVGIKCKGAEIRFASKHIRRTFVYSWCASVGGYEECPMCKALSGKMKFADSGNGNRKLLCDE